MYKLNMAESSHQECVVHAILKHLSLGEREFQIRNPPMFAVYFIKKALRDRNIPIKVTRTRRYFEELLISFGDC